MGKHGFSKGFTELAKLGGRICKTQKKNPDKSGFMGANMLMNLLRTAFLEGCM